MSRGAASRPRPDSLESANDDRFVHPGMDRADEQVRARRQRGRGERRFSACRYEVERTEEERRRCGRAEQDLIEGFDDPAAAELRHLRATGY